MYMHMYAGTTVMVKNSLPVTKQGIVPFFVFLLGRLIISSKGL
jgi:hypothetical protein